MVSYELQEVRVSAGNWNIRVMVLGSSEFQIELIFLVSTVQIQVVSLFSMVRASLGFLLVLYSGLFFSITLLDPRLMLFIGMYCNDVLAGSGNSILVFFQPHLQCSSSFCNVHTTTLTWYTTPFTWFSGCLPLQATSQSLFCFKHQLDP